MSIVPLYRNYYYLVAGLPDIVLEDRATAPGCAAFMDSMEDFIDPDDVALLRLIRMPFDNMNLVTVLESRNRPFESNGNYAPDELAQGIKMPSTLPPYMQQFVEARKENRQLFPDLSPEDQLNWLFYDEVTGHPNEFIAAWFSFDLNLRNVLAALSVREGLPHLADRAAGYERCLASCIVCRNDVAEQILRSAARDFGLSPALPWVEHIIELPPADVSRREKALDELRWNMLDELSLFTGFHIESILAFCVKLLIVERWKKLDPGEGRRKMERLLRQMQERFQ
jgi:hypothetical protein